MTAGKGKNCLATVTSESFIPGALVMIHSFLKHNIWFKKADGDIVIIHDAVPLEMQERFNCFKNITWLQVGNALKKSVDALCKGVPNLDLEHKKKRFYSMELFRLKGYNKVLFCDSDILFLDNITELFQGDDGPQNLLCCGDFHYYTGTAVDAVTLLPAHAQTSKSLKKTFNAGLMVVAAYFLTPLHYKGLLDLLDIQRWNRIASPLTDQVIYNLYFGDRCKILDSRYNFLVHFAKLIEEKENRRRDEIKVVHFNGKAKPWEALAVLDATVSRPMMIPWIKRWYQEYMDFLSQYHLHSRFADKKGKDGQ